jgi:hypothetical protein
VSACEAELEGFAQDLLQATVDQASTNPGPRQD